MKTVMLTGGTGAIGSVLARFLLQEEATRLRLLIRADSSEHLRARLEDLGRFWEIDPHDPAVAARLEAVAGDVTLPRLGLDEASYRRLCGEVTHVIHCAGNVRLNRPLEEARRAAVDSAQHVVSFARSCRGSLAPPKLEFVSTVGVAGRMSGEVPERAFGESRTFRNSYEAAKAEAETFVLQEIEKGLAATIHRPSMVVGDSRDGRIIQFQVFYYLCEFLTGRRTAGFVPDARDVRLDIVPVDYVARAIQVASGRPDAAGRIFHLCAGPAGAPRINRLADQVREIFAASGRRMPALRRVPVGLMRSVLPMAQRLAPRRMRPTLGSLPFFLAYLDEPQTFANTRTRAFLDPEGVSVPSTDTYLGSVLSYYLSRESGRPRRGQPAPVQV